MLPVKKTPISFDEFVSKPKAKYNANYTLEEIARIQKPKSLKFRNLVVGIDISLGDFFDKWKAPVSRHGQIFERLYLGKPKRDIAVRLSEIFGTDMSNRNFTFSNDEMVHIGKHMITADNQIAITREIFEELPDIIHNPDNIIKTTDRNGRIGAQFEKILSDGKIYYFQVDNPSRGNIQGISIYGYKKKSPTSADNAAYSPSSFTSETTEPEPFIDNNLTRSSKAVKSKIAKY